MEEMTDAERRGLLKDEYLHLQGVIEQFDSKALTIKAWSVTLGVALLGAGFNLGSVLILALGALGALFLWSLETMWKTFQYAYYDRVGKIEDYFQAGAVGDMAPLQTSRDWYSHWNAGGSRRFLRIACWGHVMFPHVLVFAGTFAACLFVCARQ